MSCLPGGGDLAQSITELKNIVLDFLEEVRGQLATINATVSSLQGQLESLTGEVVRNRDRINAVNKRVKTVESGQVLNQNTSLQLVTTTDRLSTGLNQLRIELTANQQSSELAHNRTQEQLDELSLSLQQQCRQTSLEALQDSLAAHTSQLATTTDQLSTGLNQLRTELTANQHTISERVDGVSSQQVRIQNETMVQLQIVHTTIDIQLANATDKLFAKLRMELTTNQSSSDLEHNRTQMKNVSAQEQNFTEAPQDTQDAPVYQHTCGGSPGWHRVAFLNMTDPSQDCPSGWSLTSHSVRTCGRASSGQYTCDPVTFPVSGGQYSRVCGRIRAYQYGTAWAFRGAIGGQSLNGCYVDGISITHGVPRQHIWTFAVGLAQEQYAYSVHQYCYCDVQTHPSRYLAIPPSFVDNDYFCESAVSGRWRGNIRLYSENPLWDGQNCGQDGTCCSMNNPPYFMKDLPAPTTDDIEVRLCSNNYPHKSDLPVELLEIYVQ